MEHQPLPTDDLIVVRAVLILLGLAALPALIPELAGPNIALITDRRVRFVMGTYSMAGKGSAPNVYILGALGAAAFFWPAWRYRSLAAALVGGLLLRWQLPGVSLGDGAQGAQNRRISGLF